MLSQDDIKRIAGLSRIKFTEEEGRKFSKDLSAVLDFVSQLKEAEGEVSDEQLQKSKIYNVLREDLGDDQELEGMGGDLVNMAPDKKNGYVKVKRIL